MGKNRLEAFSDGVIAIIITIMVLEFKVPHGSEWADLRPMASTFWSYLLSFIFVGIYWNNHHHLLHTISKVNGPVMWANQFLLFCLSIVPFATAWMGENNFASVPVAFYGVVIFSAGMAFFLLSRALIALHGRNSELAKAIGKDRKGIASQAIMAIGATAAFVAPMAALSAYIVVALMWLVPDRRFERAHAEQKSAAS